MKKRQKILTNKNNNRKINMKNINSHHCQVLMIPPIPLTHSLSLSLSLTTVSAPLVKSFSRQPVSAESSCMYVFVCQLTQILSMWKTRNENFVYELMPASPAYFDCLTWIIYGKGRKWMNSRFCFLEVLHWSPQVQSYNSTDTATALKNIHFLWSERLDFNIVNNLSITVHALLKSMVTSLLVDEIFITSEICEMDY